jgi:hypothetical protein
MAKRATANTETSQSDNTGTKVQSSKPTKVCGVQVLATPRVGTIVDYWRDDTCKGEPMVGLVSRIDSPGKVQLYVVGPNRVPYFVAGVSWKGDDRRLNAGRPFRAKGVWAFHDEYDPLDYHRNILESREDSVQRAIKERRQLDMAALEDHENEKTNLG